MNAMSSDARVNAGQRPVTHLRAVLHAVDEARTNNGSLIFCGHGGATRPTIADDAPMRPRLNALFANSVNSPS
jgi:hypothetical protein